MNRKLLILHLLGLMICACLPMTPIMYAGVEAAASGKIADLGTGSVSDFPIVNSESPRWDLLQIEAPEAWPIASGGRNAVVAILDTGIDANDKSLQDKVVGKVNITNETDSDTNGHGTFIAGLIAGTANNSGIAGVAYNSNLLDVKVAENNGTTDAKKVAAGILWAVDHGANIINVSIVFTRPYPLLEYAVDYAWKHGSVIVAAAGNSDSDKPVYPANYPNVIAVAATDKDDSLAKWSNRGDWVTVAAPGVNIYSTLPDNCFGYKSGSSFSTALVSGEAALLFPRAKETDKDGLINDKVRNLILSDSDSLGIPDEQIPRVNVYNATKALDEIQRMLVKG